MKRLALKISLFLVLYLLVGAIISWFVPFHWGNPWYSSKLQYLEEQNQAQHNTFFFGSSRIYRQIDPSMFDSTVERADGIPTHSFNMGAPATFCPQSYFLYEKFLESDKAAQAKTCFLELMEVDGIRDFFMHQERTTYWQNPKDVIFAVRSIMANKRISLLAKLKYSSNYLISYSEKVLHLGHFGQQLTTRDYYHEKYAGPEKNGFFSLERDLKTTDDLEVKEHLSTRFAVPREDPNTIVKRKQSILRRYQTVTDTIDQVNLERIKELIRQSKDQGIHLICLLSPRNASQELVNLSRQLPKEHFIDMANPESFDELYTLDNSFDIGHLNDKGSTLYSKLLALEFSKISSRLTE